MTVLRFEPSHIRACLVLSAIFSVVFGLAGPYMAKTVTEHGLRLQVADATVYGRTGQVLATSLSGGAEERPGYFWGGIYRADTQACIRRTDGPACEDAVTRRIALLGLHPGQPVPSELLGFTPSPLHPDISLAAALYQVPRIAAERHLPEATVAAIVRASVRNSIFNTTKGLYVNRLELNLKLDGKLS